MIDREISALVRDAIERAVSASELEIADAVEFDVEQPRDPSYGDWSVNAAMRLAKTAKKPPRLVAETIVKHLPDREWIVGVEIAGPGFINFRLSGRWLHDVVRSVLTLGSRYGSPEIGNGSSVNVEFVSINPTGPLHIGSARNAALGDSIARLLEFSGYKVTREYYFNDAGSQMTNFGLSVAARYLELLGKPAEIPPDGYHGTYVLDLAREILDADGDRYASLEPDELGEVMRERVYPIVIRDIEQTLERFRVHMDVWFKERELYEHGKVHQVLERLAGLGYVYEHEGAQWLRGRAFGDDRDRVVVRSFGAKEPTYLLPDLAYHLEKVERGFEQMIVVLGADHHGHGPSLKAGMGALGVDPDRVEVLIYQMVHLRRGGEPVAMGKRTGTYVTLAEMIDAVGTDSARYHLLHSSADNTLYFDFEEVKKQSDENPVYYVQYAHARIASIFAKAASHQISPSGDVDLALLTHPSEIDLMKGLANFPDAVDFAVRNRAPYRLTRYAEDLAHAFSGFYRDCVVLNEDHALTRARLAVCAATKQVLATSLDLLGVEAPERMEREDGDSGAAAGGATTAERYARSKRTAGSETG